MKDKKLSDAEQNSGIKLQGLISKSWRKTSSYLVGNGHRNAKVTDHYVSQHKVPIDNVLVKQHDII